MRQQNPNLPDGLRPSRLEGFLKLNNSSVTFSFRSQSYPGVSVQPAPGYESHLITLMTGHETKTMS